MLGALHAIFVKEEIFCETVDDPIQFGYYCTMTNTVFDKVERVDVLKKWELLFKIRMGRRMNEGDLFAILIGGDPFWLVRTLWKGGLEIALGMTRPIAPVAVCVPSNTWPGRGVKQAEWR